MTRIALPSTAATRLPKAMLSDRPGRVGAHAGQLPEIVHLGGDHAAGSAHDDAGRLMEVAGAGIVAEALPGLEDAVLAGPGERPHVGKLLQEPLVVGDDRVDAGLLEHDLGHPDPVGVLRPAPGQIPFVCPVPVQKQAGDFRVGAARHEDRIYASEQCVNRCKGKRIKVKGERDRSFPFFNLFPLALDLLPGASRLDVVAEHQLRRVRVQIGLLFQVGLVVLPDVVG